MEHSIDTISRHLSLGSGPVSKVLPVRTDTCPTPGHGDYEAKGTKILIGKMREIWTKCPACDAVQRAEDDQAALQQQTVAARQRMDALLTEVAIPARFIGRSFQNFQAATPAQADALQTATEYAANFPAYRKRGIGLVMAGAPGTGKSHLAAAILQAILPRYPGLYITCMGAIRLVRSTWRKDSDRSEDEVLAMLAGVPLLVLDEIGVQYGTDGEQTVLFDILDRRYREMKPTILLTNQTRAGLKESIGDRSFDRIRENSKKWITFDWPSFRAQAREEASTRPTDEDMEANGGVF